MDNGNWSAVIPLAVAIGGGVSFIAYKHPREYKLLAICINVLLACLSIGGVVWDVSNSIAYTAALESDAIIPEKINVLHHAITAHSVPWWWYPVLLVAIL